MHVCTVVQKIVSIFQNNMDKSSEIRRSKLCCKLNRFKLSRAFTLPFWILRTWKSAILLIILRTINVQKIITITLNRFVPEVGNLFKRQNRLIKILSFLAGKYSAILKDMPLKIGSVVDFYTDYKYAKHQSDILKPLETGSRQSDVQRRVSYVTNFKEPYFGHF